MGKGARNRRIRKLAYVADPTGKFTRSIARAFRRHGRMPLEKREGQR